MTVATDKQAIYNGIIDTYGETFTLRHFTGINASDSSFDDIYDEVDITKTDNRRFLYDDYTLVGIIQPITLSSRENRLKHSVVGYTEQSKMQLFIKTTDKSGNNTIKSVFDSPSDFNLGLDDQIIHDDVTYIVNYIEPWKSNGIVVYFKILLKIDVDEV